MGKCTVLVVEDEDSTRMQLARVIRKEGYDVIEAENGRVGLEMFGTKLPDIVVTDIMMPSIDGLEMIHHMRRISSRVQIILITAYGETETVISALRQGVIDYLKKPLDLDLLCLALGRAQEKVNEYRKLVWVPALLLAEDEQATRDRLARVLEKENWKVFSAADGDEAVNIFAENKIDIVLLDISMPRKDGLQALKEMNALSSDFQAIVFSGYGDEKTAMNAMRNGASNFLIKPIDLDQLVVSVVKAIERLNTERALNYRTRELELTKEIVATIQNALSADGSKPISAAETTSSSKRSGATAIRDPRIKAKCPQCGGENVESRLSFTNIVAWLAKLLGAPTVKIFEKRCSECGHEFQVFPK